MKRREPGGDDTLKNLNSAPSSKRRKLEDDADTREPVTEDITIARFEQLALDLKNGGPIVFTKTSRLHNDSSFSKHMYDHIKSHLTDDMTVRIEYKENKITRREYGYENPRIYREVLILVIINTIPIINLALVRTKDDPAEPVAFYLKSVASKFRRYNEQQFELAIRTLRFGVSGQAIMGNTERKRTVAGFLMELVHHLASAVMEYSELSDMSIYLEDSWKGYDTNQSIDSETFEEEKDGVENAKRYTASKKWPDISAYDMHTSGFYGAWGFKNVPDEKFHRAIELVGGYTFLPWKRAKVFEMRTLNASMAHP
jgi:hypothetical protein